MAAWLEHVGEAATTSLGFFWKAGWAFVLGYSISAMIEAFVPRLQLTRFMAKPDARSLTISTAVGAVSSSCSFAALAAARSLIKKGAHFVAGVAFMFASTNLVIELGILILMFLGWQFLVAEVIGGLLLIAISAMFIRATYPRRALGTRIASSSCPGTALEIGTRAMNDGDAASRSQREAIIGVRC